MTVDVERTTLTGKPNKIAEVFIMRQLVSIREANQNFSKFIQATEEGSEIIITRRGTPVACLIPYSTHLREISKKKAAARQRTLARMKKGYHLGGKRLTRDELHERR